MPYILNSLIVIILIIVTHRKGLEFVLPIFIFIIIIVPIESLIRIPGLFDLNAQRISLITLFILFFIYKNKFGYNYSITFFTLPLKFLILASILWNLLSNIYSIVPIISLKRLLYLIVENYLLYYLILRIITKTKTIYSVVISIIAAMSLSSVFGIVETYFNWSVINVFPQMEYRLEFIDPARGLRARSVFPNAILFGSMLAISIPQALFILSYVKKIFYKYLLWFLIFLMILALYKTISRGPYLALGMSILFLFLFSEKQLRKNISFLFLLALIALIFKPAVWDFLVNFYNATFDNTTLVGSSLSYRFVLANLVVEELSTSFMRQLLGFGMGCFPYLHLEAPFLGRYQDFLSCDNSWLSIMIESGYIGLIIMLLLLIKAGLLNLMYFIKMYGPDKYLFLLIFTNLTAYYFLMTNVSLYGWGQPGYLVWILISISIAHWKLVVSREQYSAQVINNESDNFPS